MQYSTSPHRSPRYMSVYVGLLCVDLGVFGLTPLICSIARICPADAIQTKSAPVAEVYEREWAFTVVDLGECGCVRVDVFYRAYKPRRCNTAQVRTGRRGI
jgi:hypothetical protein